MHVHPSGTGGTLGREIAVLVARLGHASGSLASLACIGLLRLCSGSFGKHTVARGGRLVRGPAGTARNGVLEGARKRPEWRGRGKPGTRGPSSRRRLAPSETERGYGCSDAPVRGGRLRRAARRAGPRQGMWPARGRRDHGQAALRRDGAQRGSFFSEALAEPSEAKSLAALSSFLLVVVCKDSQPSGDGAES